MAPPRPPPPQDAPAAQLIRVSTAAAPLLADAEAPARPRSVGDVLGSLLLGDPASRPGGAAPPAHVFPAPDPATLLLLLVQLDDLTLTDGMAAYGSPEDPLLPVGELSRLLELDVDVSPSDGRITGRIGEARRALIVDLVTNTARIGPGHRASRARRRGGSADRHLHPRLGAGQAAAAAVRHRCARLADEDRRRRDAADPGPPAAPGAHSPDLAEARRRTGDAGRRALPPVHPALVRRGPGPGRPDGQPEDPDPLRHPHGRRLPLFRAAGLCRFRRRRTRQHRARPARAAVVRRLPARPPCTPAWSASATSSRRGCRSDRAAWAGAASSSRRLRWTRAPCSTGSTCAASCRWATTWSSTSTTCCRAPRPRRRGASTNS